MDGLSVVPEKGPEGKNQMSLREAAASDYAKGLRNKLTGWGAICRNRAAKGLRKRSRRIGK